MIEHLFLRPSLAPAQRRLSTSPLRYGGPSPGMLTPLLRNRLNAPIDLFLVESDHRLFSIPSSTDFPPRALRPLHPFPPIAHPGLTPVSANDKVECTFASCWRIARRFRRGLGELVQDNLPFRFDCRSYDVTLSPAKKPAPLCPNMVNCTLNLVSHACNHCEIVQRLLDLFRSLFFLSNLPS